MRLTDIAKIWDLLVKKDLTGNQHTGRLGELYYCDLKNAINEVVGVINDIVPRYPPSMEEFTDTKRTNK